MQKFKKFLFFSVIFVSLACLVVGCSINKEQSTAKNEQSKQQQAKEEKAKKYEGKSLLVYSGAGLRKPMNEIGKAFEDKYGAKINYTYAGSAQNLSQIELNNIGDIYTPGALYYFESAKEKGLTEEKKDVAYHIPVIAVPKGNPANIETLEDLGDSEVRVVLGDEKACAIGKVAKKILKENSLTEAVGKNVQAKAATVNELVVYVTMKQADASIIWEDNVMGVEEIEIVEIPKEQNQIKTIPICVLKSCKKTELAQAFVDFVTSKEGKTFFEKHGFKPVEQS